LVESEDGFSGSLFALSGLSVEVKTMKLSRQQFLFSAAAILLIAGSSAAHAQGLKSIDPPGGGKIIYGQVAGATTEAAAMGTVLHNLHQNLGTRPEVGKLFQVKGTGSYAVFLSVKRNDQGAGKAPMQVAGLLIATKVSDGHVEAALLSDEASRFPKTLPGMSKTLFATWHPFPATGKGAPSNSGQIASSGSAPAAALHTVVTQDRSASMAIPDGWKIEGSGGTVIVTNPNGSTAWMDFAFGAQDTNNPSVQRTMQQVRSGQLRAPAYVNANYIPYGADTGKTFVTFMQTAHKKAGFPPADYNLTSISPGPAMQGARTAHIQGTVDFKEGKGQREFDAVYCIHPPGRFGHWASEVYMTTVPMQYAAQERATLAAMMASFRYDPKIVGQEANEIAGPEIARIQAIGHAAKVQADNAHRAEDAQISRVEKYWDNNDKQSQAFSNLQLGYSVVSTTDNQYHGTFWNEDATMLVEGNPDKFQYVPTPGFWKGIDY
jgi:hypothetical protein